jgi:predicted acyltransferase
VVSPDGDLTPPAERPGRLVSLDALRGLNMFWIVGVDELVPQLSRYSWGKSDTPWGRAVRFLATQLDHVKWEGLHFEDLIYPLFIVIVGVSIVFSLTKAVANNGRGKTVARVLVRSAVLYLLGVVIYGGFDQPFHAFAGMTRAHHAVRWFGVLQRIAIVYASAGLLFCWLRPRWLLVTLVVILVGYWLAMTYIPVPGVGTHAYGPGRNLANYLDQRFLGGWTWENLDYDPEGYLSNIPAIGTCLLGVFAGLLLRRPDGSPYVKVAALVVGGAALAGVGYAWGFMPSPVQFPVIKKIWTSSFVLLAAGYSAVVLGLFYLVVDVWRLRVWATPFVWIGTNAITIYMLVELGFVGTVAQRLVGGGRHTIPALGGAQEAVTIATSMVLTFAVARFLYVRQVFIRV